MEFYKRLTKKSAKFTKKNILALRGKQRCK